MKLSKLLSLSILAILPLVGCNKSGGGSPTGGNGGSNAPTYNLVTDISQISTGYYAILRTADGSSFISGSNGNKDATVATSQSGAKEYAITVSGSTFTLKDEETNSYIAAPSANEFKYGDAGAFSVNEEGHLICNDRYLCINTNYYRFYSTSQTSYTPFFMYACSQKGGQGGGSQGGGSQGEGSAINTPIALIEYMAKLFTGKSSVALNTDYYQYTDGSYYVYDEVTVEISEATYTSTVETYVDLIPEDYLAYVDDSNNYVVVDTEYGYAYADFASDDADQPNVIAEIWVQANEASNGFEVYICSYTYAQWQATLDAA